MPYLVVLACVAFGFVLGLLRPWLALAAGVALFVLVAGFAATRSDESQDGEPITGLAAVIVVFLWALVPWLIGAGVAAVVRRGR
jgi:uncharacterized membrane-anchored protein